MEGISMFGSGKAPRQKVPEESKQSEAEEVHALLDKLAAEEEEKLMAGKADLLAELEKAHAEDVAGYSFECERWKEFLSLKVERLANPEEHSSGRKCERSAAAAINLPLVTSVKLLEGHGPDLRGEVEYDFFVVDERGNRAWKVSWKGEKRPPEGHHWKVFPIKPLLPVIRPILGQEAPAPFPVPRFLRSGSKYEILLSTEGYPRPALDDAIHFEGVNTYLFAPAGEGHRVYEAIMGAIGS